MFLGELVDMLGAAGVLYSLEDYVMWSSVDLTSDDRVSVTVAVYASPYSFLDGSGDISLVYDDLGVEAFYDTTHIVETGIQVYTTSTSGPTYLVDNVIDVGSLGGVVEFLSELLHVAEEGEGVVDLSSLVSTVEKFV